MLFCNFLKALSVRRSVASNRRRPSFDRLSSSADLSLISDELATSGSGDRPRRARRPRAAARVPGLRQRPPAPPAALHREAVPIWRRSSREATDEQCARSRPL